MATRTERGASGKVLFNYVTPDINKATGEMTITTKAGTVTIKQGNNVSNHSSSSSQSKSAGGRSSSGGSHSSKTVETAVGAAAQAYDDSAERDAAARAYATDKTREAFNKIITEVGTTGTIKKGKINLNELSKTATGVKTKAYENYWDVDQKYFKNNDFTFKIVDKNGTVSILKDGKDTGYYTKLTQNNIGDVDNLTKTTTEVTPKKQASKKKQDTVQISDIYGGVGAAAIGSGGAGLTAGLSPDQLNVIMKIIAAEGGEKSTEEALAIASTMINRVNSGAWGGSDLYTIATKPNQYVAFQNGAYAGKNLSPEAQQAVMNAFSNNAPIHGYSSFKAPGTRSGEQFTSGGNVYH